MPPSLRLYMYQTRQQGLHSHAGTSYASFLTLVHVSNETARLTLACRNPLCLLPFACTCIKRGRKELHSHAGTAYASFLTIVHVSNKAARLTLACRNPLCLLPYAFTCIKRYRKELHSHAGTPYASILTLVHVSNDTGKNYICMQEPPMPPSLRLYMYQTRQERITFACRNSLCLHPYACSCIKRDRKK